MVLVVIMLVVVVEKEEPHAGVENKGGPSYFGPPSTPNGIAINPAPSGSGFWTTRPSGSGGGATGTPNVTASGNEGGYTPPEGSPSANPAGGAGGGGATDQVILDQGLKVVLMDGGVGGR